MNNPQHIALIIALAIYTPGTVRCSQEHSDFVYEAVDATGFEEEQKAELYARIEELLTPDTPLREAEFIIEQAIRKVVTRG